MIGLLAYALFAIVIGLVALIIFALLTLDIRHDETKILRCYRCGRRALCKRPENQEDEKSDEIWICSRCGNVRDEFGNTL